MNETVGYRRSTRAHDGQLRRSVQPGAEVGIGPGMGRSVQPGAEVGIGPGMGRSVQPGAVRGNRGNVKVDVPTRGWPIVIPHTRLGTLSQATSPDRVC